MKFEIIPVGDDAGFICDLVWPKRPGSPTVGTGRTELEAMMAFFARVVGNCGWFATAAQRAEAFLRTLDLWEDEDSNN